MTTAERAARNSQIVSARLRGLGEAEVASRFGVTPRQVRRVLAEHREGRPRLDSIDPLEVVRDALDGYEALGVFTRHGVARGAAGDPRPARRPREGAGARLSPVGRCARP